LTIIFCRVTELLDVAPLDFFSALDKHLVGPLPETIVDSRLKLQALDIQYHWVSQAGPGVPSMLTAGISLNPTDSFETCPVLDVVLVGAHNFGYVPTEAELTFVRRSYEGCAAFLSICAGIQVPLMAGLLHNKKATGPRFLIQELRQQAPTTEWLEKRWVRDGKLWTSGALLNGTDMMNAFASEFWGPRPGEDESLAGLFIKMGGWPSREIDYKDVPWMV